MKADRDSVFLLLLIAAIAVLLGRAYQHIFFEGPYRAFFLDENYFGRIGKWLSGDWLTYVTSLQTDRVILWFSRALGVIWLLGIAAALRVGRHRWAGAWLLISSGLLLFMAFGYYLDKGFQLGQGLEFSAQILAPAILAAYCRESTRHIALWLLRLAVAFTFLGHGLYALGVYPVPGYFVHMIITNLGITNAQAEQLLWVAGWLDMGVAIGVLLPVVDRYWLAYAVFWGFLTSLARLTTYLLFNDLFWLTLHQMWFEFAIRIPHFLLPLAGLLWISRAQRS